MSAIVIYPYSNSNPTAQYRVVDFGTWCDAVNDGGAILDYPYTAHDTYEDAASAKGELNREAKR